METVRFKLYALRPEHADAVIRAERFTRVTAGYALIYTDRDKPEHAVSVEDLKRLTEADMNWFYQCNMTLLMEYAEEHKAEASVAMEAFFETLEAELKKEQDRFRKEEKNETAGNEQQQ